MVVKCQCIANGQCCADAEVEGYCGWCARKCFPAALWQAWWARRDTRGKR